MLVYVLFVHPVFACTRFDTMARSIPKRPLHEYIPIQVRRIVIFQHEFLRLPTESISILLDLPLRTVQRILERWRLMGEVIREPAREGPPRIMCDEHIQHVLRILEHTPDLYLDEIKEELWYRFQLGIALSTLDRNLRELGITVKSLSKRAAECSLEKRTRYITELFGELAERLVFVDESAVNVLTTQRKRGRAAVGKRAYKSSYFVRGDRYSVLPALSLGGVLWLSIALGSFNGTTFLQFIDRVLERMNPYPGPNSVLIMDNCAIHHVDGVRERCEKRGVRLIYLPPYSPDFNPIEEMFSAFKAYVRRHGSRLRDLIHAKNKALITLFFYEAINAVATPERIKGWYRKYM